MPHYKTHEQATAAVLDYIKKHFKNDKDEFIEYTKVDKRNYYKMVAGELPWADSVLNAIEFERLKIAYIKRGKQ